MNRRGRGCRFQRCVHSSDGENRQAPTMQAASDNEEMAQLVMRFCLGYLLNCSEAFFSIPSLGENQFTHAVFERR